MREEHHARRARRALEGRDEIAQPVGARLDTERGERAQEFLSKILTH